MKKIILIFFAAAGFAACNNSNEAKDSVEKADSANAEKLDSGLAKTDKPEILADEATAEFLVKAANGGMAEVMLGALAQKQAAAQSVKDFGAMMVRDHSVGNEKIMGLARERKVTIPDRMGDDMQKMVDNLKLKQGKEFDKAYVRSMVRDHEEDIDEFKKAADKVKDADVKIFINNTIPILQHHLDSINAIKKAMK